jgi:hypothetical protein
MGNKMVWGFGGARFVFGSTIVDIPLAIGKLWFVDEAPEWTTINDIFVKHTPKHRPMASLDLPNLQNTDYAAFINLLMLINERSGVDYKTGIMVYPRFNFNVYDGLGYEMFCTSEYSINDLHPNGLAQKFPLQFKAKYTIPAIPTFYSDIAEYNITGDAGDNLTGDAGDIVTGVK